MKLLIVDDEQNTRMGLRDIINWPAMGFDRVKVVCDGLEALEAVNDYIPDVLLCDVRMPRMNGIELVATLKDNPRFRNLQVVFLSAFSDKEYLKAAIRFNALDYVEKPVDLDEIEKVMVKAVEKAKSLKSATQDSIIERLIDDDISSIPDIYNLWGQDIGYRAICIGLLPSDYSKSISEQEDYLLAFMHAQYPNVMIYQHKPWFWTVLIAGERARLDDKKIRECFLSLHKSMKPEFVPAMATCKITDKAEEIHNAIKNCWDISNQFFYEGYGHIYFERKTSSGDTQQLNNLFSKFINTLDKQSYNELQTILDEIKSELYSLAIPPQEARLFALRILHSVQNNFLFLRSEIYTLIPDERLQETLNELLTLDSIMRLLSDRINTTIKIQRDYINKEHLALRIKNFLDEHYSEQVTLEILSNEFRYSPHYLGTIFKRKLETGITNYLTQIRIQKAKLMLERMDIKPIEVAPQVGFSNYAHFSRVFKQIEGISPREWIRLHRA